jgi:hypothetical protein
MENINTLFLYFRSILTLGVGLDFRKKANIGKPRVERVEFGGKRILDVMVGV